MPGLIYVMGPSGSGKDSLLGYARERVRDLPVAFAHRYITRPASADGENHVALSRPEFEIRSAAGLFALTWESHGNRYGIGVEIDAWMHAGLTVVVNGSRAYLDQARKRYPDLTAVLVSVSLPVLESRLRARAREDEDEIRARLRRLQEFQDSCPPGLEVVDNSGTLEIGGGDLVRIIRARTGE
ncbi:MAG TPA: phosphonate metabolism protein/1,5-bisphosphokinase (PRPP-forming) PhnN [Desulfomicrobiaceae bacterium]|nr:phosphonate metabolism protein/1,5-bisphosphokinase (PRPP-forming) PhnN [Desulfomicrobiaceae bacterium]